jgi:hypothetical protein
MESACRTYVPDRRNDQENDQSALLSRDLQQIYFHQRKEIDTSGTPIALEAHLGLDLAVDWDATGRQLLINHSSWEQVTRHSGSHGTKRVYYR